MGNTHPQSAKYASINLRKGETKGETYEEQSVSYNVDERTAKVSIKRTKGTGTNGTEKFMISITDSDKANLLSWRVWPYRFEMMVERTPQQELKLNHAKTSVVQDKDIFRMVVPLPINMGKIAPPSLNVYEQDATKNARITNTPGGGITETSLNPYRIRGSEKQKGLVVIEWKKRSWDQNPYMVTVSHYFASLNRTNTGLSVVARIRDEDGLQVEGPVFHPATSLFEMFDVVLRSGCWTPNACPHCATNYANDGIGNSPFSHYETLNPRQITMSQHPTENNDQMQQWFGNLITNSRAAM